MCTQCVMRGQLFRNFARGLRRDASVFEKAGQFLQLEVRLLDEFPAFLLQIGALGVRLRTDGDVFAGCHRHGSRHEAGGSRQQYLVRGRRRGGDPDNQAGS